MSNCLQLDHVDYAYGAAKILVLSDVSADFESGKMYAITGPSGAGKSTLLSLLAGLDAPSRGVVRFEGEDIAASGYAKHRREHVSLVFQDHNLIDYLTPEENLRLVSAKAEKKRAAIPLACFIPSPTTEMIERSFATSIGSKSCAFNSVANSCSKIAFAASADLTGTQKLMLYSEED